MHIVLKRALDKHPSTTTWLCSWLILVWVGFGHYFWSIKPNLVGAVLNSLHGSIYLIIQSWSWLGIDLLVALLGWHFKWENEDVLRIWLNTWLFGGSLVLLILLLGHNLTQNLVFDAVFPIIRNAYPVISGILLGIVFADTKIDWRILSLILLVPNLDRPSLFGLQTNRNPLLYFLIFLLAINAKRQLSKPIQQHIKWLWLGTSLCLLALTVVQGIWPLILPNKLTYRFVNTGNLLLIIGGLCLAILIDYYGLWKWSKIMTLGALVPIYNSSVNSLADSHFTDTHFMELFWPVLLVAVLLPLGSSIWYQSMGKSAQKWLNRNLSTWKKLFHRWGYLLLTIGASYFMSLASQRFIQSAMYNDGNMSMTTWAYLIGQRQGVVWLTALLIGAAVMFLVAITQRYWLSLGLVGLFNLGLVLANRLKINERQEPILPSDLSELAAMRQLIHMINNKVVIEAVIGLLAAMILMLLLEHKWPIRLSWKMPMRIVWLLILPLMLVSSYFWNDNGSPFNHLVTSLGVQPTYASQLGGVDANGPVVQFLNNVHVEAMKEPNGYSKQRVQDIVHQYQNEARIINEHRHHQIQNMTVIFNLSESFADPNRVPHVKLKSDPVPYIHQMQKQNTGGLMMSSGFGGGTANMEWMTLTGQNLCLLSPLLQVPFTQLVPKQNDPYSFVQSFRHRVAIHPYSGYFYSRINDYQKFGFDKFYHLNANDKGGNIKHQHYIQHDMYLSDQTAYDNVLDQLNRQHHGQFINLVTMQNHMPFDQHSYHNLANVKPTHVSAGTQADQVWDYATGIHYTDIAVKQFRQKIDRLNRPVVWVFYGDHLPGIYKNDMDIDNIPLHETDYFIYANKYAREHGAIGNLNTKGQPTKVVDPAMFIAMVLMQTKSEVNWYQALLTRVYQQLPAVSMNQTANDNGKADRNLFVDRDGHQVDYNNFNDQQKQTWQNYKMIQYDLTAGKGYSRGMLKDVK